MRDRSQPADLLDRSRGGACCARPSREPDRATSLAQPRSRISRPCSLFQSFSFSIFALVVGLAALGQRQLDLGPAAAVEIDRERHQRHALARHRAEHLGDLALLEQQFARPLGLVIVAVAVAEFGDVGVDQPDLLVLHLGIAFGDRALAEAQRLHLGAGQRDAGLDICPRSHNRTARAGSRRRPSSCRTPRAGGVPSRQVRHAPARRRPRRGSLRRAGSSAGASAAGKPGRTRDSAYLTGPGRSVGEQGGVERVEPVLQGQRRLPSRRRGRRPGTRAHSRGATLAVTEMQPVPPMRHEAERHVVIARQLDEFGRRRRAAAR